MDDLTSPMISPGQERRAEALTTSASTGTSQHDPGREVECPCCSGADEGAWEQLCDHCLDAWLNQNWGHQCERAAR